jgi:hypothetical protein
VRAVTLRPVDSVPAEPPILARMRAVGGCADTRSPGGDPLAIWAAWAPDLRGHSIESGHHMAEENPRDLAEALADFCSEGL